MKKTNFNADNLSISSVSSSRDQNSRITNKKNQHSVSEINIDELNCSFNPNEISCHSTTNRKVKKDAGVVTTGNYSTAENYSPDTSKIKKKKFIRKMQNSQIKENLNDTNAILSSFRDKINESSITMNEEKDNNYMITNLNDNSFFHFGGGVTPSHHYLTTEEKLRSLVKQTKRTSNRYLQGNRPDPEDLDFALTTNNHNNLNNNLCSQSNFYDIKNHSQYSNFELSKMLFEIIHNASDYSTIVLPPRYISFPHLIINSSLTIKGSPGTLVEINNGVILIASKNKHTQVSFNECSFVFNVELKSFKEKFKVDEILKSNVTFINEKYYLSLFIILHDTCVIVNDCDFRAIIHEEESVLDDNSDKRVICETCFSLPQNSLCNSQLLLQSTICSNFYRIIEAFDSCQISLSNCHFSDTISNAIFLQNIKNFSFVLSTVSNCYNAIEIFYDENLNLIQDGTVHIKISDSEFNQNHNTALKISSDNKLLKFLSSGVFYKFELRKNIFKQNKVGVLITKIMLSSLEMIDNEVRNQLETGIEVSFINSACLGKERKSNFEDSFSKLVGDENTGALSNPNHDKSKIEMHSLINLQRNTVKENKNRYGVKLQNCSNVKIQMEENRILNNLGGIHMSDIGTSLVILKNTHINDNMEVGLTLTSISVSTKIFISSCKFMKNFFYGASFNNLKSTGNTFYPVIYVKSCEISNNKKGGIYNADYALSIEATYIIDNGQWAVELPLEVNKPILKLLNYDVQALNTMINNPIGGSWGVIENKKSICSDGKCFIL